VDPTSWQTWLLAALLLGVAGLWLRLRKLHSRIASLRREREAIVGEEQRLFAFLHDLGEQMRLGSPRQLHRHVVAGLVKVVNARGGAYYQFDGTLTQWAPGFVSPRCPALLPVPPDVQAEMQANPRALRGFLQLRNLPLDRGLPGQSLRERRALALPAASGLLPGEGEVVPLPMMLAALFRGDEPMGLLVVARNPGEGAFSANDFSVFQSAAEQSGFALVNSLIHREAAEKRVLENELRVASEIQRILLPGENPEIPGFRIHGMNKPARFVSGDYFDFIPVDDNRTGIAIADVSGKGVAASLLTAMCRSTLRTAVPFNLSPADALGRLNRQLYPDIREDMFISLAYLLLDRSSDEIVMARAGHDAPMVFRAASATIERLQCPGLAVGIDEGAVFERVTRDFRFTMATGDCLLLFTDGVSEALNAAGDEFGIEALKQTLARHAPEGAAAVVNSIIAAVSAFTGDHPQSDDITLIAIEKR
jgi:phosphoserine phosphatase RsbU/P